MFSGTALFFSLFSNLALFIALVAVYGALGSSLQGLQSGQRQLVLGLAFGLFALACMHALIPVAPGVRVDQRNAVVALSGAFGGPISALITGAVAAAYRTYLGGSGVVSGVTGIGLAALAGAALHAVRAPFGTLRRAAGAALFATAVILPGFLLVGSWRDGLALFLSMSLPYGGAIFLAILLGGMLLRRVDAHREAEQRFRQMVALAPEAIVVVDRAGRIRLFNARAETYSGKEAGAVIGRPLAEMGWLAEQLAGLLGQAKGRAGVQPPLEVVDPANQRAFEVVIAPAFSTTGKPEWMLNLRDVTARKRAEEARADYEARILHSRSLEALGRLAGGVAHDFNNLLTVILGTAGALRTEEWTRESLLQDLDSITLAATKASELTAQLLAFGRKQVLEPRVLDPNQLVTALVPLLKRSLPENVELVVNLSPAIPSVCVDATQLDQVLVNLAVNGRDAMPRGGTLTLGTVERLLDQDYASAHPEAKAGRYVEISVTDTGIGMTEEVRSRVFEPFYTTKAHGKGTGLGLATVHGIVSQSGGHVSVYSEPGKGTCFRVYLPASGSSPALDVRPEHREVPLSGHVLLVEDNDLVRAPIRRMLTSLGFEVTEASDGKEAVSVALARQGRVDLLLTDVIMRDMGGPEVAAELKQHVPGLKVLFMSGYTENSIAPHGELEPSVNFLSKPFTRERLRDALARLLA